jgi:hypothetical protein
MKRLFVVLSMVVAPVALSGCVYFNGIYNAKEAASRGDARLRRGDEAGAATFFATSVASAESVLVRHPRSKYRPRALYLAGRGAALAGFCDAGIKHIEEFLTLPVTDRDSAEFHRARLARGVCHLRLGKLDIARVYLDSLVDVRDRETSQQARLWATRAALAARDGAAAERYLAGMNIGTMAWELLNASVAARDFVRVESLLVQRAAQADYRDDVIGAIRELLHAGQYQTVENVINRFDAARVRNNGRAAMHYLVGDYFLREGIDTLAQQRHLSAAQQLAGRDTATLREAAARLSLLRLRRYESMRELDSVFASQDSATSQAAYSRRVREQALFIRILSMKPDTSGAALFIAAEAARDSLRANAIARELFLRIPRDYPQSSLAANAWYAAASLLPDSAQSWKQRIALDHPTSHVAAWIRGEDPGALPDFEANQKLLRTAWIDAARAWADTLRKLRAAAGPARSGQLP